MVLFTFVLAVSTQLVLWMASDDEYVWLGVLLVKGVILLFGCGFVVGDLEV